MNFSKIFSALMAGLLCSGSLAAEPLMQNLRSAQTAGASAKSAAGEQAAVLGEDSFNALVRMQSISGDGAAPSGGAVAAGARSGAAARRRGVFAPQSRKELKSVAVPGAEREPWDAPVSGWEGFKAGFMNGVEWTEAPARRLLNSSISCGNTACGPAPYALFKVVGGVAAQVALAAPAAFVGVTSGIFGALFGAKKR